MSHPCGSYNVHTLKILKNWEQIGFKQIVTFEPEKDEKINNSFLEIARQIIHKL